MDPENELNFQIIKITRNLKNYLRATQEKFPSESSKLQYYRSKNNHKRVFTRWGKARVCFQVFGFEIYRVGGLLIFRRIGEIWRNDASQEAKGSTSITFVSANFSRNTWGGTAWKILAAHFPRGTKGRDEGGRELGGEDEVPYVLYSYFHKIYTGIPVGQLLLCRRSLTWDKGLALYWQPVI